MNDRLRRLMFALVIVFGFLAFSVGKFIMAGIALLLAASMYLVTGGGSYNDRNITDKIVKSKGNLTVEDIFEKVKDIDTPLGKAWMTNHRQYDGACIAFGPSVFKDYIVIGKRKEGFGLSSHYDLNKLDFPEEQQWRRDGVIDTEGLAVTPKRYSSFVAYKVMTSVFLNELTDYVTELSQNRDATLETTAEFHTYNYNSSDSTVRDDDDICWAKTEAFYDPLSVTVYDMEGNAVATATGNVKEPKNGFKVTVSDEDYGTIYQNTSGAHDEFYIQTEDGEFRATSFRAVRTANVSSNYVITLDGKKKAVVACSPRIEFESTGLVVNDVIMSFDDEHLLFYILMEDFIMAHNRFVK